MSQKYIELTQTDNSIVYKIENEIILFTNQNDDIVVEELKKDKTVLTREKVRERKVKQEPNE